MRNFIISQALLATMIFSYGCKSIPPITTPAGQPKFMVYVDANTAGISHPVQKRRQNDVAKWMANDCATLLRNAKCLAATTSDPKLYESAPNSYLLTIKIDNYKWRYVGTTMDISYKLKSGDKTLLSTSSGCGTSRNWRNCCRKLNLEIIDSIRAALKK